jgi:undecaprenyl-diphosphatase
MNKTLYYRFYASCAAVLLVLLGYLVRFFDHLPLKFDTPIQNFVFAHRSADMTAVLKTVTRIGNPQNIIALVVLILALFALKKWYAEMLYLLVNFVAASAILNPILKQVYQRTRPIGHRLIEESNYSFPSGHATVAMVVGLSLIFIILQRCQNPLWKWVSIAFIGLLILTIGFSRVYLGVHFPTDIIGGYLLASAVATLSYPYYDKIRFQWRFKGVQK